MERHMCGKSSRLPRHSRIVRAPNVNLGSAAVSYRFQVSIRELSSREAAFEKDAAAQNHDRMPKLIRLECTAPIRTPEYETAPWMRTTLPPS